MVEHLLDPKTLARVKDMKLIAKTVADGFLHGNQMSTQRGVGIEFSQYRGYEPGDELSRVDWKLFARSDRYFVREAERESETSIYLVVDATASMAQQSQSGAWSKLDYTRHLAATLAYIGQKQGDNVGLLGLSTKQLNFVPAAGGERHWQRMLSQLQQLDSGDYFPTVELLNQYMSRLQQPGIVFMLSDFYQQDNEIIDFIKGISRSSNEIAAIQLQCDDEQTFPYKGPVRFKDLETAEEVLVAAKSVKDSYFNALYQHQVALRSDLADCGADLCTINIDSPMDEALHHYLKQRNRKTKQEVRR